MQRQEKQKAEYEAYGMQKNMQRAFGSLGYANGAVSATKCTSGTKQLTGLRTNYNMNGMCTTALFINVRFDGKIMELLHIVHQIKRLGMVSTT